MTDEAIHTKRQRGSFEATKDLRENQKNEILNNIPTHQTYQKNHSNIIPAAQQPVLAPNLALTPERRLCEGAGAHCFYPQEKNVFSPPVPTPAPTISPQPTSLRTDPTNCESDGQGNYGIIDSPSFRIVNYRYQVETTQELNAILLNLEVLQDVEKAISDVLTKRFFLESCSPPVIDVIPMPNIQPPEATPMLLTKAVHEQDGDNSHKFLVRRLKSEYHENLVGLSANPEDLVIEGLEGEACPFPTTNGPCFVVGGGVTMFGDGEEGTGRGLMWVDEGIHEELKASMDSGDLKAALQPDHPDIVAIRYIPPGTELPVQPADPNGIEKSPIGGRTTAISWVLIGVGLLILIAVFLYTMISRRQARREEDERTAAVVGAFPVIVSKQNVSYAQEAQKQEDTRIMSVSRLYDMSSPQFISPPPELLGGHYYSESESDGDEEISLHVFQDDDASPSRLPRGISTSWRDQILRRSGDDEGGISSDPNHSFVRPILDDETDGDGHFPSSPRYQESLSPNSKYHSASSGGYSSSYYAGSSYSGSRSLRSSPGRQSPSKLTVAFDQSEIL